MDLNYDTMRVGRTFEIQARNYADDRTKDMNPDEAAIERPKFYNERLNALIEQNNHDVMQKMPASGLMVTEENRNVRVVRYRLKEGVSREEGLAVARRHNAMKESVEWDGTDAVLESILREAFEVMEVSMATAAEDKTLKRFPHQCCVEPEAPPAPSPAVEDVQLDPWGNLPPIPGEVLLARMEALEMSATDLSAKLKEIGHDVHFQTIRSWTNAGVPENFILPVRAALA